MPAAASRAADRPAGGASRHRTAIATLAFFAWKGAAFQRQMYTLARSRQLHHIPSQVVQCCHRGTQTKHHQLPRSCLRRENLASSLHLRASGGRKPIVSGCKLLSAANQRNEAGFATMYTTGRKQMWVMPRVVDPNLMPTLEAGRCAVLSQAPREKQKTPPHTSERNHRCGCSLQQNTPLLPCSATCATSLRLHVLSQRNRSKKTAVRAKPRSTVWPHAAVGRDYYVVVCDGTNVDRTNNAEHNSWVKRAAPDNCHSTPICSAGGFSLFPGQAKQRTASAALHSVLQQ